MHYVARRELDDLDNLDNLDVIECMYNPSRFRMHDTCL